MTLRNLMVVSIALCATAGCKSTSTQVDRPTSSDLPPAKLQSNDSPASGLLTLWANDPITHAMSLIDGAPGGDFQEYQAKLNRSDLCFDEYYPDQFSVAIQGSAEGAILDLGEEKEVANRYGVPETVGFGQAYSAIYLDQEQRLMVYISDSKTSKPLLESSRLEQVKGCASAQAITNHIYVLRLNDNDHGTGVLFAKLLVVDHDPRRFAVIRWQRLEPEPK